MDNFHAYRQGNATCDEGLQTFLLQYPTCHGCKRFSLTRGSFRLVSTVCQNRSSILRVMIPYNQIFETQPPVVRYLKQSSSHHGNRMFFIGMALVVTLVQHISSIVRPIVSSYSYFQ